MIDIKQLMEWSMRGDDAGTLAREILAIRRAALDMPSAEKTAITEGFFIDGHVVKIIKLRDAIWSVRLAAKDEEIAKLREALRSIQSGVQANYCDCPTYSRAALAGESK